MPGKPNHPSILNAQRPINNMTDLKQLTYIHYIQLFSDPAESSDL